MPKGITKKPLIERLQTADKPQLFNWGLLFLGPLYQYSSDIQKQHNEK
jgi:hypothetical protein